MKTTQKGITPLVILLIIAAILIGGVIYYSSFKPSLNTQNTSAETAVASFDTDNQSNKKTSQGTVLILVEDNLASQLSSELQTYSQDIKREFGLKTEIKNVLPTDTTLSLKNFVINYYNKKGLSGVLIVGNVPTGQMYNPDVTDPTLLSQGYVLSDSIYQDILNACTYSTEKNAFNYKNPDCQATVTIQPYWVARLTPNSTTENSVDLLKNYFKRNHDFRTGKITFQNSLLTYAPIAFGESQEFKNSVVNGFNNDIAAFGTYVGHYNFVDFDAISSDSIFLGELAKPNQYEAFIYNGHGLPTFQQKQIFSNPTLISGKDVPQVGITNANFVFGSLLSCSVGRFTTPDYLAGQYLFRGGLIELAASVPVLASSNYDKNLYQLLAQGIPFYKAFEYTGLGVNVLGDPTLKMRYTSSSTKNGPRIAISNNELSFSLKNHIKKIVITNKGDSPLLFTTRGKYTKQKNSSYLDQFSVTMDTNVQSDEHGIDILQPGMQTTLTFDSNYFSSSKVPPGIYTGKFYIVTNDNSQPLVEVPMKINEIK